MLGGIPIIYKTHIITETRTPLRTWGKKKALRSGCAFLFSPPCRIGVN
nr:MAG TPA: hypothetical protein [Caudoviricetes sp.]